MGEPLRDNGKTTSITATISRIRRRTAQPVDQLRRAPKFHDRRRCVLHVAWYAHGELRAVRRTGYFDAWRRTVSQEGSDLQLNVQNIFTDVLRPGVPAHYASIAAGRFRLPDPQRAY